MTFFSIAALLPFIFTYTFVFTLKFITLIVTFIFTFTLIVTYIVIFIWYSHPNNFIESETNEMENQNAQELELQEKAISTSKGEKLN